MAANHYMPKFTFGMDIGPQTLDPTMVNRTQSRWVYATIFDPLIHRAPDGTLEPRVLDSWKWINKETLQLTVHKGITFQDGTPLTAADVAFTIQRCLDPKSAQSTSFHSIESVKQVDDYTVDVLLNKPDPTVLGNFVDLVYVVPKAYYQKVGADAFANNPIGSGPFKFKSWRKGYSLSVVANEHYWKGPVNIGEVDFRILQEDSTRVAALQSGEVDMIDYVPFNRINNLGDNVTVLAGTSPDFIYLGLVPTSPALADVRVRQAINYALDRKSIATALQGDSIILGGELLPGMAAYKPPLQPYPYDPAKAKELLAAAGYHGQQIRLDVPLGRVARSQDLGQMIAAQLQAVGMNVRINEVEWGLFTDMLYRRNGQEFKDAWIFHAKSSTMDPADILNRSFDSNGGWNWAKYDNAKLNDLLRAALVEQDPAKRSQLYRQADAMTKDLAYYVPLYVLKVWYGLHKTSAWSWQPRPDEMVFIWDDVKVN